MSAKKLIERENQAMMSGFMTPHHRRTNGQTIIPKPITISRSSP
jgi:hypothetical protein